MTDKKIELSIDFKVVLEIYKYTEIYKEQIYFSKLLKKTNLSRSELSKSIDKLYDKIMIDTQIETLKDGEKVVCFMISKNFLPFVKGLYNVIEQDKSVEQTNQDARTM